MPFIGKTPETGAFKLIDSITTSATDTYGLTVNSAAYYPESARNLIVSLNGVTQAPESAYTVSGSNIVFASALTASDVIDYILVIGDAVDIGTPSDNTVGTDQLASTIDLSGKTLTFANDQISGNAIDGGTISNFASTGIDDNATSTAITIDASQNVGINNASPSELLSIIGTGGTAKIRFDGDSSNLQNNFIGITGYDDLIIASDESNSGTASTIQFRVDAAERMRIDSSGNVGIGTASPTELLHIAESTGTSTLRSQNNSGSFYFGIDNSTGGTFSTGNYSRVLYSGGAYPMVFATNNAERMRIDSSGNVGIGQSSPATKLHVAGQVGGVIARFHDNIAANCYIEGSGSVLRFANRAGSGQLGFTVNNGGSDAVRIDQNGNVGIGITSIGSKLEVVSSSVTTAALQVKSQGTSNYQRGMIITFGNRTPNDNQSYFWAANDTTNTKGIFYSNGGLANYSANNQNLCDEREKKNIEVLDSTWGRLKNWELKKFHYNEDEDNDDKRYGVIAQQIAPHCPEVITTWVKQVAQPAKLDDQGNEITPAIAEVTRMGVKEQQMMWMAIKALQEAQIRIETLEAEVAALKGAN